MVRLLDGPLSAASALKMSYGGITKGITAIAAAMFIAADRGGSADALFRELKESQPQLLAWFSRQITFMYPKAYRWVAEMEEVSDFTAENAASKQMYAAIAQFYEHIARDFASDQMDVGQGVRWARTRRISARVRAQSLYCALRASADGDTIKRLRHGLQARFAVCRYNAPQRRVRANEEPVFNPRRIASTGGSMSTSASPD